MSSSAASEYRSKIELELEKLEADQNGGKLKFWREQLDKLKVPSAGN